MDKLLERMKDMSPRQFREEIDPIFESLGLKDYSYLFYEHFSPKDIVGILHILDKNKVQQDARLKRTDDAMSSALVDTQRTNYCKGRP